MKQELSIKSKNGGIPSRIGLKFYEEIEKIKRIRIKNEKSRDKISTEKISNLIIRHKYWEEIFNDICELEEKEIIRYGK